MLLAFVPCVHAGAPEEAGTAGEAIDTATPAPQTTSADEASDHHLRVRLIGIGAAVDGDDAQFQQRNRVNDGFSGGLDELHYETEIGEDTELEFDGRAIFGTRDYLARLRIHNDDKGHLDVGYRQFRNWYDGRGGYFPPADASFVVFDPKLGIDRGEAWAKGGLILPAGFKLSVAYRYLSRDGTKSSMTWGDALLPGLAPPNNRRNIVPAFQEIDERRHQVEVAVARETARTEIGAAARYERMDLENHRNVTRSPQEPSERRFTQTDDSKSDLFGARASGVGRFFGDYLVVSGAYAYNDLDLSLGGARIYGATFNAGFDPTFANRQQRDEGFFGLHGSSTMREHVGNVSAAVNVRDKVQILSALRVRGENRHAHASFTETNVGGAPAFATQLEELETRSDTDEMSYAEDLEVRYKGIENVVLYVRGAWEQNDGDIFEQEFEPVAPLLELERRTDVDRLLQKYAAGVKAYPARWLHLSAQYAYRLSDYDYRHRIDSTPNNPLGPPPSGDRYPAYMASQTFATHDVSLRTSLRLPADVTAVLRYDWLQSTIRTRADELDEIESAQTRAHLVGTTVTWNPAPWWWTRGAANYVRSTTDTSANNYDTPAASFLPSFENDYVSASLTTGIAVDAVTGLEIGYGWLSADNYRRRIWLSSSSYGSRFTEHSVGARVTRKLGEHTRIAGSYSYLSNDEGFAGGNYDYHAHLILTTIEFEY